MFSRAHRLRTRDISGGAPFHVRIRTQYFFVRARRNNTKIGRTAVVISQRVEKKASARNRIKRIVSAQFEPLFKDTAGWDIMIHVGSWPQNKVSTIVSTELANSIKKLFYGTSRSNF